MRTIVAVAIAGGIAAVAALLTTLVFTPMVRAGGGPSTIEKEGGLVGYNHTIVTIGDAKVLADIADTPNKQTLGLDVRNNMTEAEGMLFPFERESEEGFWMNGMKFPLDIIWINSDKKVVHIEHSLPPCPDPLHCPTYQPSENAKYVLETVAGFAQRHNVTNGTQVEFQLDPGAQK